MLLLLWLTTRPATTYTTVLTSIIIVSGGAGSEGALWFDQPEQSGWLVWM